MKSKKTWHNLFCNHWWIVHWWIRIRYRRYIDQDAIGLEPRLNGWGDYSHVPNSRRGTLKVQIQGKLKIHAYNLNKTMEHLFCICQDYQVHHGSVALLTYSQSNILASLASVDHREESSDDQNPISAATQAKNCCHWSLPRGEEEHRISKAKRLDTKVTVNFTVVKLLKS